MIVKENKSQAFKHPNFKDKHGHWYLVRCFECSDDERGCENYSMAVASGICYRCGYDINRALKGSDADIATNT